MTQVLLGPPQPVAAKAAEEHWFAHEDDTRLMGFGKGRAGCMLALENLDETMNHPAPRTKVIGVYRGGEPVGFFWISYAGDKQKTAQIHAYIKPGARGKWAFHAAGMEVLRRLFDDGGVYRVEVEPLRINRRLVTLLRTKYGFKQEGIRRSALWMDGNDYDTVMLRLLRREWKRLQKEN